MPLSWFKSKFSNNNHHSTLEMHLKMLFGVYCINSVLDVGGSDGYFKKQLRDNFFREQPIFTFESNQEKYKYLETLSKKDKFWHVFPYHISNVSKSVDDVEHRRFEDILEAVTYTKLRPRAALRINCPHLSRAVYGSFNDQDDYVKCLILKMSASKDKNNKHYHDDNLNYFYEKGYFITGIYPRYRVADTLEVREFDFVLARRNI